MKIIILLLSLFITRISLGQKHSISVNYLPSITTLGKQNQSFDHYYFNSRNGVTTLNTAASLHYNLQACSTIGFGLGLEFSSQGQDIKFMTNSNIPENNYQTFSTQLNYFRIPLTVNYAVVNHKKNIVRIYSGLNLGFAIERNDNYNDIIQESILLPPANKRYKDKDWAIPIGVNLQHTLCNNIFASIGFEQMFGLTNSFSDIGSSRFGVLSEFKNSKQNRTSINIGVGINLTK